MKSWKKLAAILVALMMLLCLLSACGTQTATDTAASDDTASETASDDGLKVLHAGSNAMYGASNMDPADDWNGWYMEFFGITQTLFQLDDAYDAVPTLVKEYEEPEDGVTWVFELRDDVVFHNGEKMTAQSVVDCFERTFDTTDRAAETLAVESMEADGQTLTIVTPDPDPTFLYSLCDPLFCVYYVGDDVEDYDECSYGTGPFMLEEFTPDVECIVVKNPDYYDGVAKLDKVILESYADEDAMIMAMQNGELDLIDGTSAALLTCNEDAGFEVQSASTSRAEKIVFNFAESDYAKDQAIREAIAWSIDREGYQEICNNTKMANWGIYPKTLTYGDNSKLDIKIKKQDLDAAAKVLDDAGYKDTNNDGIREINGKPIKLKLITTSNYDDYKNFIDVLASDLKTVGIELSSELYENLGDKATFDGVDWDMYIEGKYMTPTGNGSYFFDQDVVTGGSMNQGGYSNPELDKLAEKLHSTFDEDERNDLIFEMEQMLLDDCSFIVYANGTNTYINSKRLTGYKPCPSNYYYLTEKMDLKD